MRRYLILLLGGFPDVDSALATVDSEKCGTLLSDIVQKFFNTVGRDDLLELRADGRWYFENKPLSPQELSSLKNEVEHIQKLRIWKVLESDSKRQGNKKMLEATTLSQLESAKLFMFILDIQNTRLNSIKNIPSA